MKTLIFFCLAFFISHSISSQNVGIGTSNPEAKLHINEGNSTSILQKLTTPDAELIFGINPTAQGVIGTVTNHNFSIRTTNTDRLTIGSSGKIGIGTTNPTEQLQLSDGSFFISSLGSTNDKGLLFGESNLPVYGWIYDGVGSGSDNQLHLREFLGTPSDILTIKGDGRVGFGTNEPKATLHIKENGTIGAGTVVAVLESDISNRPILQFSETANGDANSGMSIEYDGSGSGSDNKMYINNTNGAPVVTFESSGEIKVKDLEGNSLRPLYVEPDGTITSTSVPQYYSGGIQDIQKDDYENLHLPNGAKLISVEFRYLDKTDDAQFLISIEKRSFFSTEFSYLVFFDTGRTFSSNSVQTKLINFPNAEPLVSTRNSSYAINIRRAQSLFGTASDLQFFGYRIRYIIE